MNRTGLLAAIAVMLANSPSFAQMGGMGGGMGGMGGGMGGMGGGMGGQGVMQGGRFAGFTDVTRTAKVEMEGGQLLSGEIVLRSLVVDGDLGQYLIMPEKIKMIRFLKPASEVKPAAEAEGDNNGEAGDDDDREVLVERQNQAAVRRVRRGVVLGGMGGMGGGLMGGMVGGVGGGGIQAVSDPSSRTGMSMLTRGKVTTTADKEIIGTIHIPSDFRLELEFGSLTLTPVKLRSITFTDDHPKDNPAKTEAALRRTRDGALAPASGEDASPPRYFRHGSSIIVISPVGDRVTLYDLDTKKSESLELSGSKNAPLEVTPVLAGNLVALSLRGPKVTKIAVADTASGTWHSRDLREPFDGHAVPIVAAGVVVYKLGRDVYAYGAESQRWDVVLLPESVRSMPSVGPGTVTIDSHGHIYTFAAKTGKWDHVDVRAILDVGGAEKK